MRSCRRSLYARAKYIYGITGLRALLPPRFQSRCRCLGAAVFHARRAAISRHSIGAVDSMHSSKPKCVFGPWRIVRAARDAHQTRRARLTWRSGQHRPRRGPVAADDGQVFTLLWRPYSIKPGHPVQFRACPKRQGDVVMTPAFRSTSCCSWLAEVRRRVAQPQDHPRRMVDSRFETGLLEAMDLSDRTALHGAGRTAPYGSWISRHPCGRACRQSDMYLIARPALA